MNVLLWAIMTCLAVVVAIALTIPLVRRHEARIGETSLTLLQAQLEDVSRQEAAGELTTEAAHDLRLEIKRRILAEDTTEEHVRPLPAKLKVIAAFGIVSAVGAIAVAFYIFLGAPGVADITASNLTPAAAPAADQSHPAGDLEPLIVELEEKMQSPENSGDPEGWRLLGWAYSQTGRFTDSAEAYGKARAINPKEAEYSSAMGEALLLAAEGQITPAAKAAFSDALALDPDDMRARYFLAVAKDQSGDTKAAVEDWIAIINDSPADAPWVPQVRQVLNQRAADIGVDVSKRLHPQPAGQPSADQVQAISQLPPEQQSAMIRGMVDNLAAKLADDPNDAEGWMRLMQARTVLEDSAGAKSAYANARKAFAGDEKTLSRFSRQAQELGITP